MSPRRTGPPWSCAARVRAVCLRALLLRGRLATRVNEAAAHEPGAAQDQSGAVRLGDIKEEARARRSPGARFSSAPGDSRRDGQPRSGPARMPPRAHVDSLIRGIEPRPAAAPEIGPIGIGAGQQRPGPSHTTRRAGPHRAVREVEVRRIWGLPRRRSSLRALPGSNSSGCCATNVSRCRQSLRPPPR